ncbi:MAG: tetratricopeptide repeat protein [Flavobacteriales bacterium]|nr:tetratricopeptide repeat protein [Flavobacteriales bacterium]
MHTIMVRKATYAATLRPSICKGSVAVDGDLPQSVEPLGGSSYLCNLCMRITLSVFPVSLLGFLLVVAGLLVGSNSTAQNARILVLQGDSLLQLEKPQRAIDLYDQAIKLDPNADNYLARAKAWFAMDRMDQFLRDVEFALRKDSTNANANYQRAVYSLRAEDPVRAEAFSTRAIDLSTAQFLKQKAYIVRGQARGELKQNDGAIDDLEKGIDGKPSDPEILRVLARLYDQAGRHADALTVLEKLCVLEPYDVGHWSNRGFELTMLERYDEALKMIEAALEIDKDEPVALSNRAFLYMQMNKDKEAWSDVEKSLRFYPANAFALRTRAMLRIRRGDREKACEDLTLSKALGGVLDVDSLLKENCETTQEPKKK